MSKVLVVNTGSDSHKYALYKGEIELVRIHLERSGGGFVATWRGPTSEGKSELISPEEYGEPFKYCLEILKTKGFISSEAEVEVIGCRIVAPGKFFWLHNEIDGEFISKLEKTLEWAPLHIEPILKELREIKKSLPTTRLIGVSDSEFHKNMPDIARLYSLPKGDRDKFEIYRYGYHGISVASIIHKIKLQGSTLNLKGSMPGKIIVCHLGSGSSITAVKDGKSLDTSMGFTPLEGLPMGSRIGNIDAGAITFLAQSKNLDLKELEDYLNTRCGLLGLSGKTKDVRELIELEKSGDEGAKLALDSFVYSVQKYIGAYMASLGGLDLLVFTATIGERSSIVRKKICDGLNGLGIILDDDKNNKTISSDGFIDGENSSVKIAVITTDEMGEIARRVLNYGDR